jgi:hypothetical protein
MHFFAALRSQNDLIRARDALGSLGHAFKEAASRENEANDPAPSLRQYQGAP